MELKDSNHNLILGLFNTYEKKLNTAHIRSIARAAPLCWAYNLDLGLFNFPLKNTKALIDRVKQDTSIGENGRYLINLLKTNRVFIQSIIKGDESDIIIITTPHPEPDKSLKINEILKIPGKKYFLLGVGKKGIPKSVLEKSNYHLEFTHKEIPLETSTAMGILAYILGNLDNK
jgi:hypothetical protein